MGCMELIIDPEWAWEPQKGFLGLPRELRDTIYDMVLIEAPKWERRHSPLCDACPRDISTFERPVFDDKSSYKCRLRRNTGLLLANRQIHRETAPIFWSQNKFCFATAKEFCDDVALNLRHEYQILIQHVSILRVTWQDYQMDWFKRHERAQMYMGPFALWPALFVCKGLKTVEMGTEHIYRTPAPDEDEYDYAQFVTYLGEALPQLEEFALATTLVYDVNPQTGAIDPRMGWWNAPPIEERDLLYVKAKKALDVTKINTAEEVEEQLRAFNTNFAVHVKFALETTLLGVAENDFSTDPNQPYVSSYKLVDALNDSYTSHDLKLRDDTIARVQLLGLPLSQQTRVRHVKERWREDALRKAAGKPTVWEEKYKSVIQERQEEKREKRATEASKEHQARMDARNTRREEAEVREQKQQRKARRKEEAKLARSERQVKETRDAERKRVRSPK